MIGAILFINQRGESVISRFYRETVPRNADEVFRLNFIAAKKPPGPVALIDRNSYLHVKKGDMYVVAVTKSNINPALVLETLFALIRAFESYFGTGFDETSIRNNFTIIYELLDEMLDYGYPQIMSTDLLTKFIKSGEQKTTQLQSFKETHQQITKQITGGIDWREEGKYRYRKNEVYIDVMEEVNVLRAGEETLRSDVSGKIMVKTYLSGMPECQFGMNDKLHLEKRSASGHVRASKKGAIAIEDLRFHRCVKLGKFDTERAVSFVPPDGEFELMSYRVTQNINPPFSVIAVVVEEGRLQVNYTIQVRGNFSPKLLATNVVLRIPTPSNTANCKLNAHGGRAKYDPAQNAILWKFRKFAGGASYKFSGSVTRISVVNEKAWSRPPITMDFQVAMYTASGMHVRYLKVTEKSNYDTIKWVRYITKAGNYQIRI